MARSTFGGRSEQVGVAVAVDLGLKLGPNVVMPDYYDGPLSDGGRGITTDFLLDLDNDDDFETATAVLTTDEFGYAPYFQGPDNVTVLYDLEGHALFANRGSDGGTVVAASEIAAGISELSSDSEADAGTDHLTQMTPKQVARRITAHNGSTTSHQDLRDAVDEVTLANENKADIVGGFVPIGQLPATEGATPSTLALRRPTGTGAGATATQDDEWVPYLQVLNLIADGAGSGADVRDPTATVPQTATGTGTWVTIPGLAVTDAASGQKWKVFVQFVYRSTATAGIKVRHKTGAAAVTNYLLNPSFDTNTTNWTNSGSHTLTRDTSVTSQDGTGHGKATASTTNTMQIRPEWHPTTVGQIWSAGAYGRLSVGTAKAFRVDVEYGDAAGVVVRTFLGAAAATLTTGAWNRSIASGDTVGAPSTATQVRARVTYVTPAAADVVFFDAVQLEATATLPAYGSTGGSGSSAFTLVGAWGPGLTQTTPTTDNYSRITPIRYPTVANLEAAHGALGATTDAYLSAEFDVLVGGTGLTNQRIEFEFADRATDGANHASIVAAAGTFARVL